jgi:hypothetical protein
MSEANWPSRDAAERWEIESFITYYRLFPEHRVFEIVEKRERPDWRLRDMSSGEYVFVESTSVYESDRSVPRLHKAGGVVRIPPSQDAILVYGERVAQAVAAKVQKAREGYDTGYPLFLSVYANEYITIHMFRKEWEELVKTHEAVFDGMAPFAEVIFWPLPNESVFRVRPRLNRI